MARRILIADDESATRELLASIAVMQGYDVCAVSDGVDLLTVAANERFDVIITDLMMPNLNGASAAEIMKIQGSTTPVIALTAVRRDQMTLAHDSFIRVYQKPCDINELFSYVDSLLGNELGVDN